MKLGKWLSLIKWKMVSGFKRSNEAATLGVMPDYGFSGIGMRMNKISTGKTAEKYGLNEGDIVLKIGKNDVKDLISYMSAMKNYYVGDKADLVIKRQDAKHVTSIEFI